MNCQNEAINWRVSQDTYCLYCLILCLRNHISFSFHVLVLDLSRIDSLKLRKLCSYFKLEENSVLIVSNFPQTSFCLFYNSSRFHPFF